MPVTKVSLTSRIRHRRLHKHERISKTARLGKSSLDISTQEPWFSDFSFNQNHEEDLLEQIAGLARQSHRLGRVHADPGICILNKLLGDAKAPELGTTF